MMLPRPVAVLCAILLALLPMPGGLTAAEEKPLSELDKQLNTLREKVVKNPESRLAHVELGKVLYENGRNVEALTVLKGALDLKTDKPDAPLSLVMINLGQVLETERQLRLAISVYETALKEEQKERGTPGSFGPGYREAIEEYLHRAKASKDKAIKHFETAHKLKDKGDRLGAAAELQQCLNIAVDFGDVWRMQGELLAEAGRHEPAVMSFQKTLDMFPRDGDTLTLMGRSLLHLNRLNEAADALKKAIALDPTNVLAIEGLEKIKATQSAQN